MKTAEAKENSVQGVAQALGRKIGRRLRKGLYFELNRYGMIRIQAERREEHPQAKIPIAVRPLDPSDLDVLFPAQLLDAQERTEIGHRQYFLSKIQDGCFVAVDLRSGKPCYMQWLIRANHNKNLEHFRCFPEIREDEALLEQAYTLPAYRGLGIMTSAMSQIAEQGEKAGARRVLTFVGKDNIASLKACRRAGFDPFMLNRQVEVGFGMFMFNNFHSLTNRELKNLAVLL